MKAQSHCFLLKLFRTRRTNASDSIVQMLYFLLSIVIKVLVLGQSMHHSPTLLSQLANLIKNRNILIVVYQQFEDAKGDKCSCASNTCTTMHDGNRGFCYGIEENVNQIFKGVLSFFTWDIAIRPISKLIMIDDSNLASFVVLKLQFLQFQLFLIINQFFFKQSDLVFLLCEFAAVRIFLGEITVAFDLILLDQVAQHEDIFHLVLLHHSPNIVKTVRKRSLHSYCFLLPDFNRIRIQIILNLIFFLVTPDYHSRRIKRHISCIPIVWELLRVFIEFINMMLSLGHEAEKLEFSGQTPFQPFQPEIDLRYLLAHLLKILVLELPLLGYITVHYRKCFLNNDYIQYRKNSIKCEAWMELSLARGLDHNEADCV